MGIAYAPYGKQKKNKKPAPLYDCRRGIEGIFSSGGGDTTETTVTNDHTSSMTDSTSATTFEENVNSEINKNITNSLNKVVTESMVEIMTSVDNIAKVEALGSNSMKLSNARLKAEGDINIGATQVSEVEISLKTENTTSVVNDINEQISKSTSNKVLDKVTSGEKMGEVLKDMVNNAVKTIGDSVDNAVNTVGDSVDNAVNTAGDSVDNAVNAGAGVLNNGVSELAGVASDAIKGLLGSGDDTKTTKSTTTDISVVKNDVTDDTDINREFKENINEINLEEIMKNNMEKNITSEILNECATSGQSSNAVAIDNIVAESTGGDINMDVDQQNNIKLVVKCVTNTEIVNKITMGIISDIKTKLGNLDISEGTLRAAGGAISATLVSAGDAAEGVIREGGDAGEKVIGASGDAAAGIIGAATGPLMIFAGVAALGLVYYMTQMGGAKKFGKKR